MQLFTIASPSVTTKLFQYIHNIHIHVFISENVFKKMCFVGHQERLEPYEAKLITNMYSIKYKYPFFLVYSL